jgi:hypothetical protein
MSRDKIETEIKAKNKKKQIEIKGMGLQIITQIK